MPSVLTRRVMPALNAVLALCVFVSLLFVARDAVSMVFKGSGPGKKQTATPKASKGAVAASSQKTPAQKSFHQYVLVVKKNVFGIEPGEFRRLQGAAPAKAKAEAPQVYKLIGTVSGQHGAGYAVLVDAAGQQQVMAVGDEVPGMGTLAAVEADRIFIDSNGHRTEILFQDSLKIKDVGRSPGNIAQRGGRAAPTTGQPLNRGFARKTSEGSYVVAQGALENALSNPERIMTDARLLPHMVDGKQVGFAVKELKKGGLYEGLGLRLNDVLLRVNEFEISSAEAALQAFTALQGMQRVELDISRGGKKMTLSYQIR